jgi:hypothetical protein
VTNSEGVMGIPWIYRQNVKSLGGPGLATDSNLVGLSPYLWELMLISGN